MQAGDDTQVVMRSLIQMINASMEEKRLRERQGMLDTRQQVEDTRRREREDQAATIAKFLSDLQIAKLENEQAGMIAEGEPAPGTQVPKAITENIPVPPPMLSRALLPTGALPPGFDLLYPELSGGTPLPDFLRAQAPGMTPPPPAPQAVTPPDVIFNGQEPVPPTQAAVLPPAPVQPGVPPQVREPKRIMLTLPDGRQIPLATVQEQGAYKLKQAKAEAEATADTIDVPNEPEIFGSIAGQKGIRTSVVNTVINAMSRKDQIEARNQLKREEEEKKKREEVETGRVVAEAWNAGQSYPTDQKTTNSALKYMDVHPEEFPRRPRKLGQLDQTEVQNATYTIATVADVRKAYEKVKNKGGPWRYQLKEFSLGVPGKADPDFVTFNTMLRGMNNLEIKRITGAQMSESEAKRLLKGMAVGTLKQAEFEAALKVMERNAKVKREITLYGSILPDLAEPILDVPWDPAVTAPGKRTPVDKESLLKKYGYPS